MAYRPNKGNKRKAPVKRIGSQLMPLLEKFDTGDNMRMVRLWRAWDELMGDMADMARPLGHRGNKLILAAHDPVVVQEAHYLAPLILEIVNRFFGEEVFDKVLFELLNGRVPLGRHKTAKKPLAPMKRKKPGVLGTLNSTIDPDSAVGKCYRAYQQIFEEE